MDRSRCDEALVPKRRVACSKTLAVFQSPAPTTASRRSPLPFSSSLSRPLARSLSLSKLPRVHSAHRRGPKASQSLELSLEEHSVSVLYQVDFRRLRSTLLLPGCNRAMGTSGIHGPPSQAHASQWSLSRYPADPSRPSTHPSTLASQHLLGREVPLSLGKSGVQAHLRMESEPLGTGCRCDRPKRQRQSRSPLAAENKPSRLRECLGM